MSYFVYIRQRFNPQNSLQSEVMVYLQGLNRFLIPDEKLENFKADVERRITELNTEFKRCRPLVVKWRDSGTDTIFLERHHGVEVVELSLMKVYGEY